MEPVKYFIPEKEKLGILYHESPCKETSKHICVMWKKEKKWSQKLEILVFPNNIVNIAL